MMKIFAYRIGMTAIILLMVPICSIATGLTVALAGIRSIAHVWTKD